MQVAIRLSRFNSSYGRDPSRLAQTVFLTARRLDLHAAQKSGFSGIRMRQLNKCRLTPAQRASFEYGSRAGAQGRGRDGCCQPAPAQIPACAANAPGLYEDAAVKGYFGGV
jgi:hypothetical protein